MNAEQTIKTRTASFEVPTLIEAAKALAKAGNIDALMVALTALEDRMPENDYCSLCESII